MKMPDVPEVLTDLSDDDLHSLATSIQKAAEGMRDSAAESEEDLTALESLAAQFQFVIDEMAAREEAASQRNERVEAAMSKLGAGTLGDDSDEYMEADMEADMEMEEVDEDDDEDVVDVTETVAEAAADASSDTVESAAANGAALAESTIPADPAEGRVPSDAMTDAVASDGPNITTDADTDVELADPTTDAMSDEASSDQEAAVADTDTTEGALAVTDDAVAALSSTRTKRAEMARHGGETRVLAEFVDNGLVEAATKGKTVDRAKLASLVVRKHGQLMRLGTGATYDPVVLATATHDDFAFKLGTGHEENFSVIQQAISRGKALVASGGNCAPLAPNWDVFNVAEPMSPIENFLPSIGAPRGGIRYVQPPQWPQAQAGVRFTTEAEDAAGYTNQTPPGTTAPKPCVHMQCRPIVECEVDFVSQCVTFGNLQYRTFSELVEVFLDHLAVAFAQAKEIDYLDTIEAGSTAVNFTPAYGATRGLVFTWALAAHAYRKRNHMPLGADLDLLVPDTLLPLVKADMVNDLHLGMEFVTADAAQVVGELSDRLNLNVEFYYDYSSDYGASNALQQAQAVGPLNPFPTGYRHYLFAPGTWVRLDGGTLDVGIIRDSDLNSTNDLQMFSEEFVQVCKVGVESIRLDITLCPDGTGPEPVAALACAS